MNRILLMQAGAIALMAFSIQAQWMPVSTGLPMNWQTGMALDTADSLGVVIATSEAVDLSSDGGKTRRRIWDPSVAGFERLVIDISMVDKDHIWAGDGRGRIWATGNGGRQWSVQFFDSTVANFINYIHFFDLQHGVAMGDGFDNIAAILRTEDGGATWHSMNTQAFGAASGDVWRRIDFVTTSCGYFFASGLNPQRLRRTDDQGASWSQTPAQLPYVQALKFYDRNIGLAVAGAGRIFRTLDAATSWQEFPSPHSGWGHDIEFSPFGPAWVWMTDNKKIFFSSDTGRSWSLQGDSGGRDIGFSSSGCGWLLGDIGTLLCGTYQNNSYMRVQRSSADAQAFELGQNVPNPFNGSTTISVSCPQPSRVRITVYTLLGRMIATLMDQDVAAGVHVTRWDADIAPGIYFYRMAAVPLTAPQSRYSSVKRMLLVK